MKKLIFFSIVLFIPLFAQTRNQMAKLYEYVINDYYEYLSKNNYITNTDSIYIFWEPEEGKIEFFKHYNINIHNGKIYLGMPNIKKTGTNINICRIFPVILIDQYIVIALLPFGLTENDDGIMFENSGVIHYYFELNNSKKTYTFYKKIDYGI